MRFFRLYPPLPEFARTVEKETQLSNLLLPVGVQVAIPTILVHQDKLLWGEDAKEFKPEIEIFRRNIKGNKRPSFIFSHSDLVLRYASDKTLV